MFDFEVVIIGAGPGGSTAALQLNKMGIRSLLLDKSSFPRDKTCGDALSGKVKTVLNRIDVGIMQRFLARNFHEDIYGMKIFAPNRVCLDLPFKWGYNIKSDEAPGYVVPRYHMDNFLIEEVKKCKHIELQLNKEIVTIRRVDKGFELFDRSGDLVVKTRMLLIASGANGNLVKQVTGHERREKKHYAGAVRTYFEGVTGFHPDGFIELHFLDEYIPGYFWIFPVKGNRANVGLGLRSDFIAKRKINLKKTLEEIVKEYPGIKERFTNARQVDKIKGYPLPLGSGRYRRSGDRFMLLGDAAHLIDPLTGEGYGNAVYSGWVAAEQIGVCIEKGKYDAGEMRKYDKRIQRVMGVELRLSHQLQILMQKRFLVNMFSSRIDKNDKWKEILTRMYTDLELRKKLTNPLFLFEVLTSRKK